MLLSGKPIVEDAAARCRTTYHPTNAGRLHAFHSASSRALPLFVKPPSAPRVMRLRPRLYVDRAARSGGWIGPRAATTLEACWCLSLRVAGELLNFCVHHSTNAWHSVGAQWGNCDVQRSCRWQRVLRERRLVRARAQGRPVVRGRRPVPAKVPAYVGRPAFASRAAPANRAARESRPARASRVGVEAAAPPTRRSWRQ